MKNPLFKSGIKSGTHHLGGVGEIKRIRLRDIHSPQRSVDEKKVAALARFTKNMPGTPTASHVGGGKYVLKDGNHRVNAALRQGKRVIDVRVQKLSSLSPLIQFMHCTAEAVPRVDLKRKIVKKRINTDPIRRLSSKLSSLIEFSPGISRRVLAGTPWTDDEHGRQIYKAAISQAAPTDSQGESLVVTQPSVKKYTVAPDEKYDRKLLRTTAQAPIMGKMTQTPVLRDKVKASDFRDEEGMRRAVREKMMTDREPALKAELEKLPTGRGSATQRQAILKESKANVHKSTAGSMKSTIDNARLAIAQDARINHSIGKAIKLRLTGDPVSQAPGLNRKEWGDTVAASRENFDAHYAAEHATRQTRAAGLHQRILKKTHEKLVQSDPAFKPGLSASALNKIRTRHNANADSLTKAAIGGERNAIAQENIAAILGGKPEGIETTRQKYANLMNPDYRTHKKIQRRIIKEGKFLDSVPQSSPKIPEVRTDLKKFPLLRKAGIAGALVGGGLLARKLLKKKEEPQKQLMSARGLAINFAWKPTPIAERLIRKADKAKQLARKAGVGQKKASKVPVKGALSSLGQKYADKRFIRKADAAYVGMEKELEKKVGKLDAYDPSSHAQFNQEEVNRAAEMKARELLDPAHPRSLHRNAKSFEAELHRAKKQNSFLKTKIKQHEQTIASASDPAINAGHQEKLAEVTSNANREINAANAERQAAIDESGSRLRKGVGRVMGARRAALGRQEAAHGQDLERTRGIGHRNTAIGVGAGFLAGASLTGNDSHPNQPKRKELKFSADMAQDISTALRSFNLYRGGKPLAAIKRTARNVERKLPIVYHPAARAARAVTMPIPGSAEIMGGPMVAAGLVKGVRLQFRSRQNPNQIAARINSRPTTRMSAKGDILRFDVSPIQNLRNKLRPEEKSTAAHDIATGSLEGSVGGLAFVPVEHRILQGTWKNPLLDEAGKFSKGALAKRLAIGGVIGGVATGLIGAGVSAASKAKRDRESVFSAKRKLIQLSRGNRAATIIGSEIKKRVGLFMPIGREFKPKLSQIQKHSEGQKGMADAVRQIRSNRFASRENIIHFDMIAPGTRTRVATDRYVKHIHETDMDRAESGYLRTGLGGAAIGSMLAKGGRGRGALIGAGAGLAAQAATRIYTKGTKDQFGDRSFAGKRIDRAPSQIAGLAALGLAGKAAHDKLGAAKIAAQGMARKVKIGALAAGGLWAGSHLFARRGGLIQFKRAEENPEYEAYQRGVEVQKADDRDWRKAKGQIGAATQGIKRGHRLLKDVVQAAKGQKNLDSRGRERKREWDKPWVKVAITGGIGVGSLAVFHKAMRGTGPGTGFQRVKAAVDSGQAAEALSRKVPGFKAVHSVVKKVRGQAADEAASATGGVLNKVADFFEKNSTPIPQSTKDLVGEAKRRAMKHNSSITGILSGKTRDIMRLPKNEFKSKSRVIALRSREDYEAELEDFANKSGKTLKPYHRRDLLKAHQALDPRAVQRNRSELPFYKKKDFERTVTIPAIAGGSFIGGGLAAQLYAKRDRSSVPKPAPSPGGGPNVVPMGHHQSANTVEALLKGQAIRAAKQARRLSTIDANPLIRLNSTLDLLLV